MKKIVSIIMCLTLIMSTFTFVGITASAATSGYYTYSVSGGEATITDCSTSISGDITIPSTLGGYSVTSIGRYAFSYCSSLTSVTIPDSVTSIGRYAFYSKTKIHTPINSYAKTYAKENGISYETCNDYFVTLPRVAPTCTTTGLT